MLAVPSLLALGAGTGSAQPQTVDGVAIDPDAELVVAMPDDTNNMDPRIGMGSIRSSYIRQVYESLVDVDAQGKPVPGPRARPGSRSAISPGSSRCAAA